MIKAVGNRVRKIEEIVGSLELGEVLLPICANYQNGCKEICNGFGTRKYYVRKEKGRTSSWKPCPTYTGITSEI